MSVHIQLKGEISDVVLMPGDPLRAKWIAETFLKKVKLVNQVRGMLGFTGYYKNKKVTVFGSGMGIPSIGIYSHELYKFYDVKCIIRVGSTGSISKDFNVGDVGVATEAYSNSPYANDIGVKAINKILKPTKSILDLTLKIAKKNKINCKQIRVFSEDAFYSKYNIAQLKKISGNAESLECEAFGLYANAIKLKKQGLTLLTCSDSLITKKSMNPYERQTSFKTMTKLALEVAINL